MKRPRRFKKQKELIKASIDKVVKGGLLSMEDKVKEAKSRLRRIPVDLSGMSVGQIMSKYKVKRNGAKELRNE